MKRYSVGCHHSVYESSNGDYVKYSDVQKWIDCNIQSPKHDGIYLVFFDGRMCMSRYSNSIGWYIEFQVKRLHPTHWMPLPEVPCNKEIKL